MAGVLARLLWKRAANRMATRALHRFGARVHRFKLTAKSEIAASLMADPVIAEAVETHSRENGIAPADVWRRVGTYIDEMVPFFSILAYYRIGYNVSRAVLNLFYKVTVDQARPSSVAVLPRDAVVIYLMNHRSNADYVLVGYALSGQVAISYAVGEWARAFPLEYVFKTFGSYFIRRRFREALYHSVLERYVQLITRNGVTQGIFPEGGLTRDGRLQPGKIGLLDYVLGAGRDPDFRRRLYLVPVGINYDRVLEDRSLLQELEVRDGKRARPSRLSQAAGVARFAVWNATRLVTQRWRRYGRAAVIIGDPVSLEPWFAEQGGDALFALSRHDRLARVGSLCDSAMRRIGALVPVTPVPLACAALQSFDGDFVSRKVLLERMSDMRTVLLALDAQVLKAEGSIEETFERAYVMLRMRRVISLVGDGFLVLPRGRPLISYYANSVAHLLGPFEEGIRSRDALPAMSATGELPEPARQRTPLA